LAQPIVRGLRLMAGRVKCCCGCSSSYRVFVPCNETVTSVDYRAPVLTLADFKASGFSESIVYLYEDIDECDDYCGTWQCVSSADDPLNRCHPDAGGGLSACPACFDWDGTLDTPFRFVRPAELAAFVSRFTSVNDCCDLLCPSDCSDQGNVVPSDCGVCFDWGTHYVSGQLLASLSNVTPAVSTNNAGTLSGTVEPTAYTASNIVVTATSASLLTVTFDLSTTWYRSIPSQNFPADCSYPPSIEAFCCDECSGEVGSCPQTWTVQRTGCKIEVDCMALARNSSTSGTTIVRPASTCSGAVDPSLGTTCPFPTNNATGMAAGWGAVSWPVFVGSQVQTINAAQMVNTYPNNVAGSYTINLTLALSIASRDPSCP